MNITSKNSRQSVRLRSYNYSSPGFYFVTICTKHGECLFGDIQNGKMVLNEFGIVAQSYWQTINYRYPIAHTDSLVVMPNHIHGIIEILHHNPPVGAIHELPLRVTNNPEAYRKHRRKMLLPKIVGWYKMNVSKQINLLRQTSGLQLWQRNYYDHIIRNERSLFQIREYINLNPELWSRDRFYRKY